MHRALRGALIHVGRHVLFVTLAVAAVVAFISISNGTSAQTGQPVTIVPIQSNTSASTSASAAPASTEDEPPPAPARPPAAAATKPTPKASVPPTPTSAPAPVSVTWSPTHKYSRAVTTPSAPTYHYAGSRNIAALINPDRETQGFTDVTTSALRGDAGCINSSTPCAGQIGSCGETPNTIGTAETSKVYDGQYKDQFGDCLEVIVI